MVCALTYFAFNTLLVTTVLRLKRNQSFSLGDLVDVFGWVGTATVPDSLRPVPAGQGSR